MCFACTLFFIETDGSTKGFSNCMSSSHYILYIWMFSYAISELQTFQIFLLSSFDTYRIYTLKLYYTLVWKIHQKLSNVFIIQNAFFKKKSFISYIFFCFEFGVPSEFDQWLLPFMLSVDGNFEFCFRYQLYCHWYYLVEWNETKSYLKYGEWNFVP